jgi:hypothetical protein
MTFQAVHIHAQRILYIQNIRHRIQKQTGNESKTDTTPYRTPITYTKEVKPHMDLFEKRAAFAESACDCFDENGGSTKNGKGKGKGAKKRTAAAALNGGS